MKYNLISKLSILFLVLSIFSSCAQTTPNESPVKVSDGADKVTLTQVPGEFETKSLTLKEGEYQFEIANKGVGHDVGFVLVPKGKYTEADHIKAAYVNAPAATGKSSMTKVVALKAGEYEYFCPMNPTPKYALTVSNAIKEVKLTQIPGKFKTESLTLKEGAYQFEIANDGVDHEVGFVLVPKGKYDAADHIKAAYVNAPAATGKSSMTKVVALKAGEYEYFCPMNPTPKYALTVSGPENVKLTQVPGQFETKSLTLKEGAYQFEIANKGVDHEVGFVLVPKGKYTEADHIKAAYVNAPAATGKSSMTNVVALKAGEYEYFCPMNPTPKYALTVSNNVKNVKLTQVPGKFERESLTLKEGVYQFEIANNGVDHEVGFVLVPIGKYDAADHIKAAYVKAPVPTGESSMTSVVALKAGEYEYFCPLNPTAKNKLIVQ